MWFAVRLAGVAVCAGAMALGAQGASGSRAHAVATAAQSAGMDEDDAFVRSTIELSQLILTINPDMPPFYEPGARDVVNGHVELIGRFAEAYDRSEAIMARYAGEDPEAIARAGRSALAMLLRSRGAIFRSGMMHVEGFFNRALFTSEGLIAQSRTRIAALSGDPEAMIADGQLIGARTYIEHMAEIFASAETRLPALKPRFETVAADGEAVIGAALQQAFLEVVSRNEPMADAFYGSEGPELKRRVEARWRRAYPDDEILAVRISSHDWGRYSGVRYRDGRYERYEKSAVTAWVVVAEPDGFASQWDMSIDKDHLRGDRIEIAFGRGRFPGEPLDPRTTILQSALR